MNKITKISLPECVSITEVSVGSLFEYYKEVELYLMCSTHFINLRSGLMYSRTAQNPNQKVRVLAKGETVTLTVE